MPNKHGVPDLTRLLLAVLGVMFLVVAGWWAAFGRPASRSTAQAAPLQTYPPAATMPPPNTARAVPQTNPPTISPDDLATREAQLGKTHLPGPTLPATSTPGSNSWVVWVVALGVVVLGGAVALGLVMARRRKG